MLWNRYSGMNCLDMRGHLESRDMPWLCFGYTWEVLLTVRIHRRAVTYTGICKSYEVRASTVEVGVTPHPDHDTHFCGVISLSCLYFQPSNVDNIYPFGRPHSSSSCCMRYSVAHPVSRWMLCSKFNTQPRIASTSSGEFPSP